MSEPDLSAIAPIPPAKDTGLFSKSTAKSEPSFAPRVNILIEGAKLTEGDRDQSYGAPIFNLTLAGELKNLIRVHARREISPGELEALDNVLAKVARCITGGYKRDNYVDGATYFAIAGELAEIAEGRKSKAAG